MIEGSTGPLPVSYNRTISYFLQRVFLLQNGALCDIGLVDYGIWTINLLKKNIKIYLIFIVIFVSQDWDS